MSPEQLVWLVHWISGRRCLARSDNALELEWHGCWRGMFDN